MLFGEHAVIHKHPCLVTAVDLRVFVSIENTDTESITLVSPDQYAQSRSKTIQIDKLASDSNTFPKANFVLSSVKNFYARYEIKQGLKIITSGPKLSFGLGSSSAVTVATNYALLKLFNIPFDEQLLFDISYEAVLDVQKIGSGFDVASAIYGKTLYFQTNKKPEILVMEDLPIVIGYSGAKVSTVDLVQAVEQLRIEFPELINHVFETIGETTKRARLAILDHDWKTLGKLANVNQGLLESLGVSSLTLNEPILAARKCGALGAKLSGAGGGDCMFAIVDSETVSQVVEGIEKSGAKIVRLKTNTEGVRLESGFESE